MNISSEAVIRLARGVTGVVLVIAGIIYSSWIGFLGAFLLLGALGGGCGIGSRSCSTGDRE